jgi:putative redox protein
MLRQRIAKESAMAEVKATIGTARYPVTIESGGHALHADEPRERGGADAGPAPYDLLLAALGACTTITLRMYADRKEWPLEEASVSLIHIRDNDGEHIKRTLRLKGPLDEVQRARIADIAERTPVTLTLKRALPIYTLLDPPLADSASQLSDRLDEALEETFPASDPPAVTP